MAVKKKKKASGSSSKARGGSKSAPSRASKAKKPAAKAAKAAAPRKWGSGKRDLVKTPTGNFFAHREADGQFREMDEVGRSLAADRRVKAKTKVRSGYGDRGDR